MYKYVYVVLLMAFSSCKLLYGIKDIDYSIYDSELNEFTARYSTVEFFNCRLDSSFYVDIKQWYDGNLIKNLHQPLQVFYFDQDSLVSYHVNCNAGGFPNLNWNRKGNFDVFPPVNQKDILSFGRNDKVNIIDNAK